MLFVPYGIAPAVTAAKKRYAPYARKPYKSVDYAGKGRCAAAEYGRYKIKLEYAKLTETFSGQITLNEKPPVFVPGGPVKPKVPNKKQDTLQNIIDKVNERFEGKFTDADRVIIEGIYQMFMKDSDVKKFKKYAKDNSTEMFVESLFPDKFKDIVTQCFLDNNEAFQKLFNDPEFYQKVQDEMAKELYKSLRKD